jgi:hypothetical protein
MSEDKEPDRLAELVMPSEAVRREMEQAQQFYRDNQLMIRQVQEAQRFFREHESLIRQIRQIQQLQPVIQGHVAMWRQIEPIVQAAQQFVRDARRARTSCGPVLPFAQWVALAVDASIRELMPPREPVVHVTLSDMGAAASTLAMAGLATASGSAAMPSVRVQAERSAGQILALVLLWLVVLAVPAAVMAADLPPEAQVMLDAYDAIFAALAVKITFRVLDERK